MNQEKYTKQINWWADLLDTKFEFAGIRFGWDAIIGLIPVVGDWIGALLSLYIVVLAHLSGAGLWVIARMVTNILIESVLGSIPIFGDAFDVFWKANLRNAKLLQRAQMRRNGTGA